MAACEEAGQHLVHDGLLTDEGLADFHAHALGQIGSPGQALGIQLLGGEGFGGHSCFLIRSKV